MGDPKITDPKSSNESGLSIKAAKSDLKYYAKRNKYKRMEYVSESKVTQRLLNSGGITAQD